MIQHKIQSMILVAEDRPVFPPVPVQTTATFDQEINPLVVELQFEWTGAFGPERITWEVARDLLARGAASPAPFGKGDFQLCYKGPGTNLVEACLRTPEGHAHVGFNHVQFSRFLEEIEKSAPAAEVDMEPAIDELLKEILG